MSAPLFPASPQLAPVVELPRVVDPVPIDTEQAFAEWLDELASDCTGVTRSELLELLQLAAAAQRDWSELVRQLGPGAITSAPARAAAEALEAILERLRRDLTNFSTRRSS